MNPPLVSVIIPVYNTEQYLCRCLDSVLSQSYKKLEVILVDDGSTDCSCNICDEYAANHDNVYVVHITNGGASMARRLGLQMSHGDYVTFVDSDDYVSPNYVSTLLSLIHQYQVSITACGVIRTNPNEQPQWSTDGKSQLLDFDQLMSRFFKYEFWGFPGKLYKHEIFGSIEFPKATLSEDYKVMAQIFHHSRCMAESKNVLYAYEYHPSSLSHTVLSARAFEEFDNVKWVFDYTSKNFPHYASNALSNAVETCVKLYLCKPLDKERRFSNNFDKLLAFLRQHRGDIKNNKHLPANVRRLAIMLICSPFFALVAHRFFTIFK